MDFINWTALGDSPIISGSVHDVILPIILPIIVVLILWKVLYSKQEARQIKREDDREIRQVEREDKHMQKQIEATQEAVRIDFHTENLRKHIEAWLNLLPEIPLTELSKTTDKYDGFDISFLKKIKALELYQDYFYHDLDVKKYWAGFESLSTEYSSKIEELFNLIKIDTDQKLENLKIENSFYGSVFRGVIIEANNKNNKYDFFWSKMNRDGIDLIHLGYCEVWENRETLDHTNTHKFNTGTCCWLIETNEPESIENLHKKLIKECKERYIKRSTDLFKMETALRESKDELYNYLKTTRQKPFLKLDCEFIKRK